MLLTIGIPTYRRAARVKSLLLHLLGSPASESVDVVVIDDGDDGTHALLAGEPDIAARVRVLKNDRNLGYPRTFARLFEECRTEYLMLMADDDEVVVEHLAAVLQYLEHRRPAFAAPQFLKGETVYRGRSTTGPIDPADFLACAAHAPGLIYRVDDCRPALRELTERIEAERPDALLYPQVIVVMRLMIAGAGCEWLAIPTAREIGSEPSELRDADGRAYWALESRWAQLKSFDALISSYVENDPSGVAQQILDAQRARVFFTIASAIARENPALGEAFDQGAERTYRWQSVGSRFLHLPPISWVARVVRGTRQPT